MNFQDPTVCRICLDSGATLPIFDVKDSADPDVYFKLCQCVGETIKDESYFPRKICELCHSTLNTVTKFIEQYKVSTQTLQMVVDGCNSETITSFPIKKKEYVNKTHVKQECSEEHTLGGLLDSLQNNSNITIKKRKIKESISTKRIKHSNSSLAENSYFSDDVIYLDDVVAVPVKRKTKNGKHKHSNVSKRKVVSAKCKANVSTKSCEIKSKTENVNKSKDVMINNLKSNSGNKQNDVGKRLCELCGETFKDESRLYYHRSTKHSDCKCPHCDKRISKPNLAMHLARWHSKPEDLKYSCIHCGKMFANSSLCRRHERLVHISKEKAEERRKKLQRVTCDLCNSQFRHKSSLMLHLRIHTGERPEVCVVCNKSFTNPSYLREHMRLHTGEKPYECPICLKGHTIKSNMKSHMKHNHRISDLDEATIDRLSKSRINYLKHMKP